MKDKIIWALVGFKLGEVYFKQKCDQQIMLLTQGQIPAIPPNLQGNEEDPFPTSTSFTDSKGHNIYSSWHKK